MHCLSGLSDGERQSTPRHRLKLSIDNRTIDVFGYYPGCVYEEMGHNSCLNLAVQLSTMWGSHKRGGVV